ncbi:MAG: cation:H+ antiporter [Gammaproteobacteria bacterium]|jgi:cation:H+ antiporter
MVNDSLAFAISVFVFAAIGTVSFGVYITLLADELAERTNLGRAVVGAIFLGALTSIAEVGTSITAALTQHPELAVNNAVGSIAAQTAFIALADLTYRRANLEHAAASVSNLMLMGLLLALVALLILAMATPDIAWGAFHPISVVVVIVYIYGMRLVAQSGELPMWHAKTTTETNDEETRKPSSSGSLAWLWSRFALVGLALAGCGVMLANSGVALAEITGLSETFVGALLTGVTTSLPELVTAITAVRIGALTLAVSNIIGGNAFDAMIIAFSDFAYLPGSIYEHSGAGFLTLLATALLMNIVVLLGLLRRERHGPGNIGLEGVTLLGLYAGFVYWLVG